MSFVERVNQGESLASWLNWLTEPPAVCWSVIMGDLSASWKGVYWTLPTAFRTGQPSSAVHSMIESWCVVTYSNSEQWTAIRAHIFVKNKKWLFRNGMPSMKHFFQRLQLIFLIHSKRMHAALLFCRMCHKILRVHVNYVWLAPNSFILKCWRKMLLKYSSVMDLFDLY